MTKTRLTVLVSCFIGSCLLVIILYFFSRGVSSHLNGFIRKVPSHKVEGLGFMKLYNKYGYFIGGDQTSLYLGDWSKRNRLLKIPVKSRDSVTLWLSGMDTVKVTNSWHLQADSTMLYLLDGNKPLILSGETRTGRLIKIYSAPYYLTAVALPHDAYILTIVDQKRKNCLVKLFDGKLLAPYVLEEQGDGVFSTDGILLKTPNSSKLFYIYFYRNQFVSLDKNLNILYKGKTIDTVNHAHIKVSKINSTHQVTLSAPPLFVNKQCAVNDKWLFIHSALKADNEVRSAFDQAAVIDVYSVNDGKYAFSFYLEDFDKHKMKDFRVFGNKLFALFDDYLYFYQLNF